MFQVLFCLVYIIINVILVTVSLLFLYSYSYWLCHAGVHKLAK